MIGKTPQREIAEKVGVTPSAVTHWLQGKRDPGSGELLKLAQVLGKTMDELYSGRYPETKPSGTAVEESPRNWGGPYWGTSDTAPVVSPVSAGTAHAWEDEGHDAPRVKVNCKDPHCYCVEVWGDSMEPIYHPGDLLVIAPSLQANANDLVVFKNEEGETFFKKYLGKKNGMHWFLSLNPNYPVPPIEDGKVLVHPVHSVIRPLKGKIF